MCEQLERMRADYDWCEAMAYGPGWDACASVVAASEGQNDAYTWVAVFVLQDGRYGFLEAGCDYTGWDCRADGRWCERDDLRTLALNDIGEEARERLWFVDVARLEADLERMRVDDDWLEVMRCGPGFDAVALLVAFDAGEAGVELWTSQSWIAVFVLKSGRYGFIEADCGPVGWPRVAVRQWCERDDLLTLATNDIGEHERERLGFSEPVTWGV